MALKVFARTRWDDFHDEREALSILRDKSAEAKQDESQDSNNVVQYLGSFSYDCETDGKTYNLLLEYGEQDLDEYFADHAPPVACEEIYSFWEGLFKIANALLSVHSFSYEAGRDYDGYEYTFPSCDCIRKLTPLGGMVMSNLITFWLSTAN